MANYTEAVRKSKKFDLNERSRMDRKEIAEEIVFAFCFDAWLGARTLTLRLISQHTTY